MTTSPDITLAEIHEILVENYGLPSHLVHGFLAALSKGATRTTIRSWLFSYRLRRALEVEGWLRVHDGWWLQGELRTHWCLGCAKLERERADYAESCKEHHPRPERIKRMVRKARQAERYWLNQAEAE